MTEKTARMMPPISVAAKSEGAEGDQQRDRRVTYRKKHFRDRHGEEAVDQEVKPFEHVANRGSDGHAGEPRARRRRAANCGFHGHCLLLSFPALLFAIEPLRERAQQGHYGRSLRLPCLDSPPTLWSRGNTSAMSAFGGKADIEIVQQICF